MSDRRAADSTFYTCLASLRGIDPPQRDAARRSLLDVIDECPQQLFATARALAIEHYLANLCYQPHQGLSHPDGARNPFPVYVEIAEAVCDIQRTVWHEVSAALRARGVQSLLMKGIDIVYNYDPPMYAISSDIDILVRSADLPVVTSTLRECGYSQDISVRAGHIVHVDQRTIANAPADHYELFPFTWVVEAFFLDPFADYIEHYLWDGPFLIHDRHVHVVAEIDVHTGMLGHVESAHLWVNPKSVEGAQALGTATYSWLLPWRFYIETLQAMGGSCKLLADCCKLLASKRITLDDVYSVGDRYPVEGALYYVYRFIREELGFGLAPEEILELKKRRQRKFTKTRDRAYADRGDFLPRLESYYRRHRIQASVPSRPLSRSAGVR